MFRILIPAAITLAVALPAAAVAVDVSPGALSALVDSPATVTELTVSGAVDARDLFFIADEMPALRMLDLSAATIAAYEGAPVKQLVRYDANEIPAGCFAGSGLESVAFGPGNITIGEAAFAGSQLKSVDIPAGYVLGAGAFAACGGMVSAQLEVAEIPAGAFSGCARLSKVSASGALRVGNSAFRNCTSLSEFSASGSLRGIGDDAFAGCTALTSFTFPASLAAIGNSAFSGSGLQEADLSGCSALTATGDWTFSKCPGLRSVWLPASVSALGSGLFFDCPRLATLRLPAACTMVGDYAMKGIGATGVDMPPALEHLGDYAMAAMPALENIYVHRLTVVPGLGENVWAGTDQPSVSLHVLDVLYDDFAAADQWRDFALVNVASESDVVVSPRQQVRGRFEGKVLKVDFGGLDALGVALYDVTGMKLAAVDSRGMAETAIDSSAWAGKVFLVSVALADGKTVSLKLGRN